MKPLYYLASPYTHEDKEVMKLRAAQAGKAVVELQKLGVYAYSPIASQALIAELYELPVEFEFWQNLDLTYIDHMDGILVLTLDGWYNSRGVLNEIKYTRDSNKGVVYLKLEHCSWHGIPDTISKFMKESVDFDGWNKIRA